MVGAQRVKRGKHSGSETNFTEARRNALIVINKEFVLNFKIPPAGYLCKRLKIFSLKIRVSDVLCSDSIKF